MRFLAAALPLIMVLVYAIVLLMQKHANKHKLLKSLFTYFNRELVEGMSWRR